MARIPRIEYETATPEIKAEWDGLVENDHPVTNMKATLLHSPVALHASMDWYSLRDQVRPFLGARLTVLFCHAISRVERLQAVLDLYAKRHHRRRRGSREPEAR